MALKPLTLEVKTTFDDKGVKEATSKITNFAKGVGTAALGGAAAGLAVVGTAAAAATVNAVQFADETNAALEEFRRTTDKTAEEAQRYKQIALDVFGGDFGASIGDVAEVMAQVETATGASGDELQRLTEKALAMRDRFDIDVAESLRTVDSLLKNNVVNSADEAFDTIVAGMTEGLNKSDDLLDTLNEYAQDFGALGFTAKDTLSIIQSGLDAGIFNTDKIGDALNEAFINLKDPTIIENLGELDQGLADIAQQVAQGDLGGAAAFEAIQERLRAIEDPLARNAAGVEIYRSMWEDLGEDAILALDATGEGLDDIAGASDRATDTTQNLSQQWAALGRDFMIALEPAAQELLPLLGDGIAAIGDFLTAASPRLAEFVQALGPAFERAVEAGGHLAEALGLAEEGAADMDAAMALLDGTLNLIIGSIDTVSGGIDKLAEGLEIARALNDQVQQIKGEIGPLGSLFGFGGASLGGIAVAGLEAGGLSFQEGGVVPGAMGQPRMILAHGGETIASAEGQAIVVDGSRFAVHRAAELAAAIDRHTQRAIQAFFDELAERLL